MICIIGETEALRIMVRAFGPIQEIIGREQSVSIPDGSTLADLINKLVKESRDNASKLPSFSQSRLTIVINGSNPNSPGLILKGGDRVDILSPFAGG